MSKLSRIDWQWVILTQEREVWGPIAARYQEPNPVWCERAHCRQSTVVLLLIFSKAHFQTHAVCESPPLIIPMWQSTFSSKSCGSFHPVPAIPGLEHAGSARLRWIFVVIYHDKDTSKVESHLGARLSAKADTSLRVRLTWCGYGGIHIHTPGPIHSHQPPTSMPCK